MTDPRPSENTDHRFTVTVGPDGVPWINDKLTRRRSPFITTGVAIRMCDLMNTDSDEADRFGWDTMPDDGPTPLGKIADLLEQTNRHLEAIAHELHLKNRVVGL